MSGGIMYAAKSITKDGNYTEEFLKKIINIPQKKYLDINKENNQYANSKYPIKTIDAMNTLKSVYKIGDLKFCNYTDKNHIFISGIPYSELIKTTEENLSKEIDEVYNRNEKKFIKAKEINHDYKNFRKDVKNTVRTMKFKSAKKAALTIGLSSAYITYLLGRLTMKPKKTQQQIQNTPKTRKTPQK